MIISKKDVINRSFNKIANIILNQIVLVCNDYEYRPCEIEFYYRSEEHDDLYVHCNEDQLEFNSIYFHKFANGTFKSGTFKGMDMTFGIRDKDIYFGILIRSIMDLETNEFIEGPCKSVERLIANHNAKTIQEFIDKDGEITYKKKTLDKKDIYEGTRVGLSDKYPEFKDRNYRYAIMIEKIKKQKKFESIIA